MSKKKATRRVGNRSSRIIEAQGKAFNNSIRAAMANPLLPDCIDRVEIAGNMNIVTLKNGITFQVQNPTDIPKVIKEMGERARGDFRPTPVVVPNVVRYAQPTRQIPSNVSYGPVISDADYVLERKRESFKERPVLKLECEWCNKIFTWTMNSGAKVCCEQCGEMLAKTLLESPDILKLPSDRRKAFIQAYRSLDNAESFNNDK